MEDANFQNKTVEQIYAIKEKHRAALEAWVCAWFTSDRDFFSCQAAIEDLDNASGTVKSWKSSSALSYTRYVYAVWNPFFDCPGVKSKEKKAEKAAEKARQKNESDKKDKKADDEEEDPEPNEDAEWDWPEWDENEDEAEA